MLKRFIFLVLLSVLALSANNFRSAMIAYQKGNYLRAKILFETSMKNDKTVHSGYMLGRMSLHGEGVPVDIQKSIKLLTHAYQSGNIPAGCYLSEARIKSGVNVYLAAEGVKRGMAINLAYCEKIYTMYRAYNFDISTFSQKDKKDFLKSK